MFCDLSWNDKWARTLDIRKTFKPVNYPEETDSDSVPDFINKDEGFAIHANTRLLHTVDGGENWEVIWPPEQAK